MSDAADHDADRSRAVQRRNAVMMLGGAVLGAVNLLLSGRGVWLVAVVVGLLSGLSSLVWLHRGGTGAEPSPAPTVQPSVVPTAVADWYPDPAGLRRLRYFDGKRWTAHVAD